MGTPEKSAAPGASPAPATKIANSGSITEEAVKEAVPLDHPAVDSNPREGTTADQNRIDFNDPTLSGAEAVEANLAAAAS